MHNVTLRVPTFSSKDLKVGLFLSEEERFTLKSLSSTVQFYPKWLTGILLKDTKMWSWEVGVWTQNFWASEWKSCFGNIWKSQSHSHWVIWYPECNEVQISDTEHRLITVNHNEGSSKMTRFHSVLPVGEILVSLPYPFRLLWKKKLFKLPSYHLHFLIAKQKRF